MHWRPYASEIAGSRAIMSSVTDLTRLTLRVERSGERQTKCRLDRSSGSSLHGCGLLGSQWLEQGGTCRLGPLRQSRLSPAPYRGKAPQITREVEEGSRKPDFAMHLNTLLPLATAIAPTGHGTSSPGPRALCHYTGFYGRTHRTAVHDTPCTLGYCTPVQLTCRVVVW